MASIYPSHLAYMYICYERRQTLFLRLIEISILSCKQQYSQIDDENDFERVRLNVVRPFLISRTGVTESEKNFFTNNGSHIC